MDELKPVPDGSPSISGRPRRPFSKLAGTGIGGGGAAVEQAATISAATDVAATGITSSNASISASDVATSGITTSRADTTASSPYTGRVDSDVLSVGEENGTAVMDGAVSIGSDASQLHEVGYDDGGTDPNEEELLAASRRRFEVRQDVSLVRSEPSLHAQSLCSRVWGDVVAGCELTMNGWLRLDGERGWMLTDMRGHNDVWVVLRPMDGDETPRQFGDGASAEVGGYHSQGVACFEVLVAEAHVRSAPSHRARTVRSCGPGELVFARSRSFDGWLRLAGEDGWMRLYEEASREPVLQPRPCADAPTRHGDLWAVADLWAAARRGCGGRPLLPSLMASLRAAERTAWQSACTALVQLNAGLPAGPLVTEEILELPQVMALRRLFRRSLDVSVREIGLERHWGQSEVTPSLPSAMQVVELRGSDFLVDLEGLIFEELTGDLVGAWNEEDQDADWWAPAAASPEDAANACADAAAGVASVHARADLGTRANKVRESVEVSEGVIAAERSVEASMDPITQDRALPAAADKDEQLRLQAKNKLLQRTCAALIDQDLQPEPMAKLRQIVQVTFNWLEHHPDASKEALETKMHEVELAITTIHEDTRSRSVAASAEVAGDLPAKAHIEATDVETAAGGGGAWTSANCSSNGGGGDAIAAAVGRGESRDRGGGGGDDASGAHSGDADDGGDRGGSAQFHRPPVREGHTPSVVLPFATKGRAAEVRLDEEDEEEEVQAVSSYNPSDRGEHEAEDEDADTFELDGVMYRISPHGEVFDMLTGELVGAWNPALQRMELAEDVLLVEHKGQRYIVAADGSVLDAGTHEFIGTVGGGILDEELAEAIASSTGQTSVPVQTALGDEVDEGGCISEGDLRTNLEVARELAAGGRHRLAAQEYTAALRKCERARTVDVDLECEVLMGRAECWSKLGAHGALLEDVARILAVDARQAQALAWRRDAERALRRAP